MNRIVRVLAATAVLLAGGCDEPLLADVSMTLSEEIATVATVRWDQVHDDADSVLVEYGPDGSFEAGTLATPGEDGRLEAVLMGMKPASSYTFRAVEVVGDTRYSIEGDDIETGPAPSYLPRLRSESQDGSMMADGFVVTSILSIPCTAVIIDGDGDYVWWHRFETEWDQVFIPRVRRSRVGQWVIYQAGEEAVGGDGANDRADVTLVRVALDGTILETIDAPDGHHDFAELSDGSVAFLSRDTRDVDGLSVHGDRIVEARADGTQVEVWSIWDHAEFEPVEVEGLPLGDWTHANALEYEPALDAFFVSLRNRNAILKIDRPTGEVLWQLGGEDSDFVRPETDEPLFERQHQFEVLDDGIVVFDNGLPEDASSRVVEYVLDEAAGEASLRWGYIPEQPIFSVALGDVNHLPNDHKLIVWSSSGKVEEVTPDKGVVWELYSELGAAFGYSTWRVSLDNY